MEIRIAKLSMLLDRVVESTPNSDAKQDRQPDMFGDKKEEQNEVKSENKIDSHAAMLSLSVKGMKQSMELERQSEDNTSKEPDAKDEMSKQLNGLSTQVINGYFSITDRINFDTELKRLSALLENADNEYKCEILSQRIDDLSKIINDAAVYKNSRAAFALVNPYPYYEEEDVRLNMAL